MFSPKATGFGFQIGEVQTQPRTGKTLKLARRTFRWDFHLEAWPAKQMPTKRVLDIDCGVKTHCERKVCAKSRESGSFCSWLRPANNGQQAFQITPICPENACGSRKSVTRWPEDLSSPKQSISTVFPGELANFPLESGRLFCDNPRLNSTWTSKR
ncbi:hypothetical protein MFFC18_46850 [Mariniblastus fucicola]|uniref:Uncharacterized protein n=1 Tax=Mariniblastus fucicola TaxID=980251 RepID=A0A5B9PR15_9BACT|nr:hypothetical protein MFFC18_46850 [Mariniblastus fucicola]